MILITGGLGYIGSHTLVELLSHGYDCVVLGRSVKNLEAVQKVAGKNVLFCPGDVQDKLSLEHIFKQYSIDVIIHLSDLKSSEESIKMPITYYENNVWGAINLIHCADRFKVKTFIFGSSSGVYGNTTLVPIKENAFLDPVTPYNRGKIMVENILRDWFLSCADLKIGILRYFNPVGAYPRGMIGENPSSTMSSIISHITQVAIGRKKELLVFGNDYSTDDGTCVRDYVHVMDVARSHRQLLEHFSLKAREILTLNIGSSIQSSILDVIHAFEKVTGKRVPYRFVDRRK